MTVEELAVEPTDVVVVGPAGARRATEPVAAGMEPEAGPKPRRRVALEVVGVDHFGLPHVQQPGRLPLPPGLDVLAAGEELGDDAVEVLCELRDHRRGKQPFARK